MAILAATVFGVLCAAVWAEEECRDGVCPLPASFGREKAALTSLAVETKQPAQEESKAEPDQPGQGGALNGDHAPAASTSPFVAITFL